MKQGLKALFELQKLDVKIFQLESRKREIPKETQQINRAIQTKEKELQKKQKTFEEATERRKNSELELEETRDRMRHYKSQLLQVKTNKEYQALLHEINTEEAKISAYEEEIIELLSQSEDLSKNLKSTGEKLQGEKEEFKKEEIKLQREFSQVNDVLKIKDDERIRLAKNVGATLLTRYEQIKKGRDGVGIVKISGSICSGCNAVLPPQFIVEVRKGKEILSCEQCGRILVWEEDVA